MSLKKNPEPGYTAAEKKFFKKLDSPKKIQDFLELLQINFEPDGDTMHSPRIVLREGKAHCMEGAMLAAAALEFHGHPPLLLDLRSKKPGDVDHVVAVFKQFGCFGAISKTNHAVLRYREPIYRTLRELALSYFHEYFLNNGKKTLREYSDLFDLNYFNKLHWRTTDEGLYEIAHHLDRTKHYKMLSALQVKNLRKADTIEIQAGKLVQFK